MNDYIQNKKMNRTWLIVFGLMFLNPITQAQTKQKEKLSQVWVGYFNQTRLTDKWGIWLDVHLRTKENLFTNFSQALFRGGVTYYFNDATRFTAGYAYVHFFPGDNHKKISQPEHRPWQQILWQTKYGKKRLMQWFRLDERFRRKIINDSTLGSGYGFNWKLRYNFLYDIPLSKKGIVPGALSFVVNDEIHINFGKEIVNNYFDQNRFFLGLKYQTNKTDNLQFGYLNVFQQLAAGNKYKSINAARIFYFHNLDLRKKN
jgi:hypothetical protein